MASAQQLIGLIKSHAEGNQDRFFDLAMQLAAAEEQKGHRRLAEQLRQWAEAGQKPGRGPDQLKPTPITTPRGNLAGLLSATYPTTRLNDLILPSRLRDELAHVVAEARMADSLERKGLRPRRRLLLSGPRDRKDSNRLSACRRAQVPSVLCLASRFDHQVHG